MKYKKSDFTQNFYKPKDIANILNVTVRTVQNYCIKGLLTEIRTETDRRIIPKDSIITYLERQGLIVDDEDLRQDLVYARVSTHKQKSRGDLERQIDYINRYVITKSPNNLEIITDVGSGLNDTRKGYTKLIHKILEGKVKRVFILYKDRLTRFGYNTIKQICDYHNVEIIVVNNEESNISIEEELVEDIISIIHSFSGNLYGMRGRVREQLNEELKD